MRRADPVCLLAWLAAVALCGAFWGILLWSAAAWAPTHGLAPFSLCETGPDPYPVAESYCMEVPQANYGHCGIVLGSER